jgi:hypothetical protein
MKLEARSDDPGSDRSRDDEESEADRAAKRPFREAPGRSRAEPGSRHRSGETDCEHVPVDLEAEEVAGEAGRAEEDAHDEVRADRGVRSEADGTEESREPKSAEDETDGAAGEPDDGARERRGDFRATAAPPRRSHVEKKVEPVHREKDGDEGEEAALGNGVAEVAAHERAGDRGRRHPRDEAPVDAAGAGVAYGAGRRRHGRDRDVRPGGGRSASGGEEDRGQTHAPEHEPDERAEERGDERAGER